MGKVFVMRGIPGAGKSTWANINLPDAYVVSADHFFTDAATGAYNFDPAGLSIAHNGCLRNFLKALAEGIPTEHLVVDNTNVRLFEISPYYRVAESLGWKPEIVWVHADPEKAAARCAHGVPTAKVEEMAQAFDPLPAWWRVRHVYPEEK